MRCEIKKINYTPEVVDDETGEIKKDAFFALALNIELSDEMKELLMETMLSGKKDFHVTFEPVQKDLPGLNKLGVEQVGKGG